MDKRVYLLTTVSFVVGMVELIIGGILDLVANDLGVTLGQAGLLITIFSVVFAISAPILLIVTEKMERTRLTLISLSVFFLGNVVAVLSTTYGMLVVSRIISAMSGSLLIILCITLASNIVEPAFRGRAIGIVVMGVSGSLVLGMPLGIMLGHTLNWRAPFVLIAILTILLMVTVYFFMGKVAPRPSISLRRQLATLKNNKILLGQMTTFFFLAGHFTLYGYLTPYLKTTMGFNATMVTIVYLVYGIAAVAGGGLGGFAADRFGIKRSIIITIVLLWASLIAIPYVSSSVILFGIVLIVWGIMSWAITPPMQSHLMLLSPETSDIQQSLNNSALHFGIAFGTFIGSIVIERATIDQNAHVGSFFIIIALIAAVVSTSTKYKNVDNHVRLNEE